MFKSVIVTLAATTLLFAQSSSTIQFYDSLGVTKTARFGWQGAPTTGKFFIETPSDNAQNVTVDKGELTAKKVSGDGSGLTNVVPKDGSVTGEKIGVGAVDSTKINTNAVTTIKIKDGAVTNAKVADVDWAKITNKPSIPSEVIANGSVDSSKLAVGAVRPIHIRNNAIDSTKINNDAVTTSKIKDGAVTDAKVAGVDWAKITNKPSLMISGTTFPTISAGMITTTGNVGVGTENPLFSSTFLAGERLLTLSGSGAGQYSRGILCLSNPKAAISANDWLGEIGFVAPSAGAYISNGGVFASIASSAEGTSSGRLGLYTKPQGGDITERIRISSDGNVGVGTTAPTAKLESWGDNGQFAASFIGANSTNNSKGLFIQAGTSTNDNALAIVGRSLGNPLLHVKGDGNVGIGTTTPGSKLHVVANPPAAGTAITTIGNASPSGWTNSGHQFVLGGPSVLKFTGMIIASDATDGKGQISFADATTADDSWRGFLRYDHANNYMILGTNAVDRLTISDSGNVGIGTTTPSFPLQVVGTGPASIIAWKRDVSPNTWGMAIDNNGNYLFNQTGNIPAMTWLNDGNVGIGTITPSQKLSVVGNICATGTVTGSCVASASDRRFKLSLTPLDSSLSKITRLQGVYYLWDTKKFPERNFDTTKQIGLIAQDVEKIIPEVVHTAKDGYKSLSYDKLTAVLIEAVKEQQKQIELQQKQSELQQKQINDLRAEIKSIKK